VKPQLVTLLDQDTQQQLLQVDVSESEMHAGEVEVTDHPVEQGANISDHMRPKPRTLTVTGMISNTPIVDNSNGNAGPFTEGQPGPAEAAYNLLEARRIAGKLHTVITKLNTYQNLALTYVSEPRDASSGDALEFTLNFKEILVVFNQTITVQTATPQGQPKKALGKKVAAPANPSAADASVLDKILFGGK
jgi:hypothetical protein